MLKRWINVKFQKEGIHCYPEAATDSRLATGDWDDVSFLAAPHMHYFHFEVKIEVFSNNRDIEFIQFRRWLEHLYRVHLSLDNQSCELLAENLITTVANRYSGRDITVSVSEDGINGAIIEYTWRN